jgi:uridine kinase
MTPQLLALEINKNLLTWSEGSDKLVVAVDGWTGSGKTTILKELQKINPELLCINQDDFIFASKEIKKLLSEAEDRSVVFELHNRNHNAIEELITQFKTNGGLYTAKTFNYTTGAVDVIKEFDLNKKMLVIEGVYMFHPKLLNKLWDKRIYLEGNLAVIDERRIKREKERWGKDYFPEDHPDSFFRQVVISLKRYKEQYKPEEQADLVINVANYC